MPADAQLARKIFDMDLDRRSAQRGTLVDHTLGKKEPR